MLFVSNLKDFIYIYIVVINIDTNIFVVSVLKFINIVFKEN